MWRHLRHRSRLRIFPHGSLLFYAAAAWYQPETRTCLISLVSLFSCRSKRGGWSVSAARRYRLIPPKHAGHSGPFFLGFKNCSGLCFIRNQDTSIYHVDTDCECPGFPVYPEYDQNRDKDPIRDTKIHVNLTNLHFRAVFNPNVYKHRSDSLIGLSLSHYT